MVSKKCYNYKGKYCKDWKVLGTVPDDLPDLCETACNTDPTCRGQFTYLDPNNGSKTCFHCTGEERNPDIDKPISPFPLLTDDVIQDLEICYDDNYLKKQKECSWDDLTDIEQKSISDTYTDKAKSQFKSSWGDLSTTDKEKALKTNCKSAYLGDDEIEDLVEDNCDWKYITGGRKTSILNSQCKWDNLSMDDKNNNLANFCSWKDMSPQKKTAILKQNCK